MSGCAGVGARGGPYHGSRRQEDGRQQLAGSHPHLLAGEGLGRHSPLHEHGEFFILVSRWYTVRDSQQY